MEQVSLHKAASYGEDLANHIIALLEPLGGLASFCKKGERVLLKPNFIMAWPVEKAATTHPALILALISLLKDLGCHVAVGDSPGLGSAAAVARKLNLCEPLQFYGVPVIELQTEAVELKQTPILAQRHFKRLRLAAEIDEFDRIINLPKLKTHGQMGLTLATKNLFGCVAGTAKPQWHYAAGKDRLLFARLLVEIALSVQATLHIVDGIIAMDGNGPSHGRPRQLHLLAAGTNPLAVDRVIVEVLGKKPNQFPIFAAAAEMELPGLDLSDIMVRGETIAAMRVQQFELPAVSRLEFILKNPLLTRILKRLLDQKLVINRKTCINCRRCERQCPAGAIVFRQGIEILELNCIKCCCCQEICPVGALSVSSSPLLQTLKKWRIV